jgi:hypothetical protein
VDRETLFKPFPITSVCRADLQAFFSKDHIAHLDDDDMAEIAGKMADAYCDQGFWIDLEIIAQSVLEDKARPGRGDA